MANSRGVPVGRYFALACANLLLTMTVILVCLTAAYLLTTVGLLFYLHVKESYRANVPALVLTLPLIPPSDYAGAFLLRNAIMVFSAWVGLLAAQSIFIVRHLSHRPRPEAD